MFTGIVREIGEVERVERTDEGARLRVEAEIAADLSDGDSVSVSGACLTVAVASDGAFEADVMNQTLSLTTLGELEPGTRVNLEPPLTAGEPLGGHLVQGHVDGTGEVVAAGDDGFARRLRIAAAPELLRYVVDRGSVVVDDGFEVALIPETLERTTLSELAEGSRVNLETDVMARYAERLMQGFERR